MYPQFCTLVLGAEVAHGYRDDKVISGNICHNLCTVQQRSIVQ